MSISQGEPKPNATKVWITRSGRCYLSNNNSKIPPHTLRNLMDIIEARNEEIKKKWIDYFGDITYYI